MRRDFVPIPGFEGLYEINSHGVVRSRDRFVNNRGRKVLRKGHIKRPYDNHRGYLQVNLHRDNQTFKLYIHRLVYLSHIGNIPEGFEVNHKNGNRLDNRAANLEAISKADNLRDMIGRNPHVLKNLEMTKYRRR